MDPLKIRSYGRAAWPIGLALLAVASLLAAIGGGGLLLAAVVSGCIAVVLLIVGAVAHGWTPDLTLSERHIQRLQASAGVVRNQLAEDLVSEFGDDGHRPRDAFYAHFPDAGEAIEQWDSLIRQDQACTDALRRRVNAEAASLAIRTGIEGAGDFKKIASVIFASTLKRAHHHELDVPFTLLDVGEGTVNPFHDSQESQEDWMKRVNATNRKVQALGQASQTWSEAVAVADSFNRLEAFKGDKRPELLEDLQLIQERVPTYARRCPTCHPPKAGLGLMRRDG